MKKIVFVLIAVAGFSFYGCHNTTNSANNNIVSQPVKVIFDTDIGGDHDDVGAVAVLHSLANSGEAEILAMGVSATGYTKIWGPPCLDAINTFYGRPDIPIGALSQGFSYNNSPYNRQIAEEFPHELDSVWDATDLYRKVLSEQPDTSVVIITVGYISNITGLLKSEADEFSDLNGVDLVNKKVKNWVCMGGRFPDGGSETNMTSDVITSKYAIENWPRPILFSGWEIGAMINSGMRLAYLAEPNPIRYAFEISTCLGCCNCSFDQAAVLAAIRDPKLYWNIVSEGHCSLSGDPEIGNKWQTAPNKDHAYLIEKVPPCQLENIIEDLMMDLPHSNKKAFFTMPLDNTLNLVKGQEFGYKMPYYNYSKKEITIKYENLPDWISEENDSIFGVAPEDFGITNDLFEAILFDDKIGSDTVSISVSILEKIPLISNIKTAFACNTFKVNTLKKTSKIYVDRTAVFESIPDCYVGSVFLQGPANDGHRYDLGDSFITFTADEDVTVFVGYDINYLELMPDWLKDWDNTKDEILNSWGNSYRLYSKTFAKGEIVLGNNTTQEKPVRLMYLILVKEAE